MNKVARAVGCGDRTFTGAQHIPSSADQGRGGSLLQHVHRLAHLAPDTLFAFIASVVGCVLLGLIAPVAGGNEEMNFQRAASIASGHWRVEPAVLPGGVAKLLEITATDFPEGRAPPYSYSHEQFTRLANLNLEADRASVVRPNAIAVLHPFSYLPQASAIAVAQQLGLEPLGLFYLGRIAGLLAGIALTFFAIRMIPFHKWTLAAVALLPPLTFSRSTLDADQFTIGLAFLFLALVLREATAGGSMRRAALVALVLAAFVLAQAKSAYLLLPLLVVAIPAERFGSLRRKIVACSFVILPGLIASLAWMLSLRAGYFEGARYRTWSGVVQPDAQMAAILSQPLDFAGVLLRTVFATPLIPKSIIDFFGVFGPPVAIPIMLLPLLAVGLAALIISEERPAVAPAIAMKSLCLLIAAATISLILTLLYLQWTRLGGPVVDGFNGRYLYPLVPLFLASVTPKGQKLLLSPIGWTIVIAAIGLPAMLWTSWQTYWA